MGNFGNPGKRVPEAIRFPPAEGRKVALVVALG